MSVWVAAYDVVVVVVDAVQYMFLG